jgi:putative ABC transport system permease protein
MIKNYFTTAWRNLIKNKAFSFINITGLAISMSVCLLIINMIAEQKSYDSFHSKKDRIYRIMAEGNGGNSFKTASCAFPLAQKLKQDFPGTKRHIGEKYRRRYAVQRKSGYWCWLFFRWATV